MKTLVAKIGTSSVTDETGMIDRTAVTKLVDEVVALRGEGHRAVIVSSGAVAAGVAALNLEHRPHDLPTLQALSAAGQSRLMAMYDELLGRHGLVAGQVLLVPHDFVNRRMYLHARQTLTRLLDLGCVPIVNENDAIAPDELRFGDNDRLAALVAHLVGADTLVLLTDTDGLFSADPRRDPGAALLADIGADDPLLDIVAGGAGSARGRGGMASKLAAARIASWSGTTAVIAQATRPGVLAGALAGEPVGTRFHAHDRRLPARKLWIAFASAVAGAVMVDEGAERALIERGVSLLPAGVVSVRGEFYDGDTVNLEGPAGDVFARGMVAMDAETLRAVARRRTSELPPDVPHEVVHRDDLVLIPTQRSG